MLETFSSFHIVSVNSQIKHFSESFANIINLPVIKRVATLMLLLLFTAKDLTYADSCPLN